MSQKKDAIKEPMSHQERVQIIREAMKMSILDIWKQQKQEFDEKLLGWIKKIFWTCLWLGFVVTIHLVFHGKYQKISDAIIGALKQ